MALVLVCRIGAPSTEVFLAEMLPSFVVGSRADFSSRTADSAAAGKPST